MDIMDQVYIINAYRNPLVLMMILQVCVIIIRLIILFIVCLLTPKVSITMLHKGYNELLVVTKIQL
jgi:hypothetical protein